MAEKQGTLVWPASSQRKSTWRKGLSWMDAMATEGEREVLSNKGADSRKRKELALSVERLVIKRLAKLYSDNGLPEPAALKPEAQRPFAPRGGKKRRKKKCIAINARESGSFLLRTNSIENRISDVRKAYKDLKGDNAEPAIPADLASDFQAFRGSLMQEDEEEEDEDEDEGNGGGGSASPSPSSSSSSSSIFGWVLHNAD